MNKKLVALVVGSTFIAGCSCGEGYVRVWETQVSVEATVNQNGEGAITTAAKRTGTCVPSQAPVPDTTNLLGLMGFSGLLSINHVDYFPFPDDYTLNVSQINDSIEPDCNTKTLSDTLVANISRAFPGLASTLVSMTPEWQAADFGDIKLDLSNIKSISTMEVSLNYAGVSETVKEWPVHFNSSTGIMTLQDPAAVKAWVEPYIAYVDEVRMRADATLKSSGIVNIVAEVEGTDVAAGSSPYLMMTQQPCFVRCNIER